MIVHEAPPPMESRSQLRAKKTQKAVIYDARPPARIADQLWAGLILTDLPDVGKWVVCTKVFEKGALLCNGLLLEGVGTLAHAKRCEANLSYDTSYLYMFKCCENFRVVDSLDSDLYDHSISRYISHSFSPNVAAKARMIAGTPTVLPNAACYISPALTFLSTTAELPYLPALRSKRAEARSCPGR